MCYYKESSRDRPREQHKNKESQRQAGADLATQRDQRPHVPVVTVMRLRLKVFQYESKLVQIWILDLEIDFILFMLSSCLSVYYML